MEDYIVPLDPETKQSCTVYLYTKVQNTPEIRKKILSGELVCCVIKASLIVDSFQVIVAANKAAVNSKLGQLTTKSIYTELLFNLSLSKNISRSLADFGISDSDTNIVVAVIHDTNDDAELANLHNIIKGERVPIGRISEFTDHDLVKKMYKIEKAEMEVSSLTDIIVSKISCKEFVSSK